MDLIDTHAHIFLPEFSNDLPGVIERAKQAGVVKIFLPSIDSSTLSSVLETSSGYKDYCYPMAGLHPCSVNAQFENELEQLDKALETHRFYGIGETGTDLYWDTTWAEQQSTALEYQAGLARKYNLPIILHSRNSMDDTIRIIKKHAGPGLTGIFHCFTGTLAQAREITEMNFLLGIGGVLTFKNSTLPGIIPEIDINHMVLETDSPYLSPAPERGKRNEPSRIPFINRKLAELKKISEEESAARTTENALKLFGVSL
jgi:TatD DNase family protein